MSTEIRFICPTELKAELIAYAAKNDLSLAEASRKIVKAGLVAENEGFYAGVIAKTCQDIVRREVSIFLSQQADDLIFAQETFKAQLDDIASVAYGNLVASLQKDNKKEASNQAARYQLIGGFMAIGMSEEEAFQQASRFAKMGSSSSDALLWGDE